MEIIFARHNRKIWSLNRPWKLEVFQRTSQTQWTTSQLQDFDFKLQHILRKINIKTDILSKKDQVDTWDNNKDIQMLKEELWKMQTTAEACVRKCSSNGF